jgi:hypothetical protein
MKKLFIVLAVASLGFVACNNEAEKTETPDTTVKTESTIVAPVTPTPDSTVVVDTTKKVDSTKK